MSSRRQPDLRGTFYEWCKNWAVRTGQGSSLGCESQPVLHAGFAARCRPPENSAPPGGSKTAAAWSMTCTGKRMSYVVLISLDLSEFTRSFAIEAVLCFAEILVARSNGTDTQQLGYLQPEMEGVHSCGVSGRSIACTCLTAANRAPELRCASSTTPGLLPSQQQSSKCICDSNLDSNLEK